MNIPACVCVLGLSTAACACTKHPSSNKPQCECRQEQKPHFAELLLTKVEYGVWPASKDGCLSQQAQHSTAQHSTARHSMAHSMARHSTAQHSTAQHSTAPYVTWIIGSCPSSQHMLAVTTVPVSHTESPACIAARSCVFFSRKGEASPWLGNPACPLR